MNALPLSDQRFLNAADGWLGLGDPLAANEELEQISPESRAHPEVLEMRFKICAETNHWIPAVEIAQTMAKLLSDNPWGHFHLAFALHELKRTEEAYEVLKRVVDKFPKEWLMRFNLACYSCRLGNLKEALSWLEKAIDLAGKKDVRKLALQDNDLEPLWATIKGI